MQPILTQQPPAGHGLLEQLAQLDPQRAADLQATDAMLRNWLPQHRSAWPFMAAQVHGVAADARAV